MRFYKVNGLDHTVYESEDECIDDEGDDESVKKNYEFFDLEWEG